MVFGESPLKDLYRQIVWGPWRELLERSPYGWEYQANWLMGQGVGRAARGKRAAVVRNLQRAFPDRSDLARVAVHAFATHFANQYASFAFGRINKENWSKYLSIDGLEYVEAARRDRVGLVLMHPHMGPAQLPLCVLGALGYPMHQIGGGVTQVEKTEVGRWATETRHRLEARMSVTLHDGKGYLRTLLRVLEQGEIVLTACDGTGGGQELGRRYERTVLGHRMRVPVGAFYLARRANARLHTLYTVRDGARYRSVIGPELTVARGGKLDATLEDGADQTALFLEQVLLRHPGDWLFWDVFAPGELLVCDC